jgi:hypothetical protein
MEFQVRPELSAASVDRRQTPPWTSLHLFKPTPCHLSIGVKLFNSTEQILNFDF